ncbi:MAG: hypothetical protein A4E28_00886 [Methanocella sp. PtaU1.Bin125]|nr:MAG: hypothetical protein A4E28_00886 [Methanocella sp. PtaU1.Bin125]
MLITGLLRRYWQWFAIAISLAALATLFSGYGMADSLASAPAKAVDSSPRPTPMVQCIVGLVLPLAAVGLVATVGRSRAKMK